MFASVTFFRVTFPFHFPFLKMAEGRIWNLVAGGGASVIFADTVADLGSGDELGYALDLVFFFFCGHAGCI